MLFNDPAFGVSFRFPSGWSFTRVDRDSKGPSLAIAYMDGRTVSTGLRGLITNETLSGLRSWPKTVFSSVEFGYDARPLLQPTPAKSLPATTGRMKPIQ